MLHVTRPCYTATNKRTKERRHSQKRMLTKERKQAIIKDYQSKPDDTGSPEVQVALLTQRISELTEHMRHNHKDYACQRGLLMLVGERRRKLAYLSREDVGRYRALIGRLGLRR